MRSRGKLEGKSDAGPQYLVLRDQLALNIELGKLPAGTRLPSERKLQSDSGAARGTVREALLQLEAEGLIYRRDRSGWYVSPPAVTYDPTRWYGFMTYVAEQGRTPSTETLSKTIVPATAALADIFRVAPGTQLYDIRRRRSVVDMCPCALVKQAADALGVKPGTPGLLVVRTSLSADGRVAEYDHEYWRHDAIRVQMDLQVT